MWQLYICIYPNINVIITYSLFYIFNVQTRIKRPRSFVQFYLYIWWFGIQGIKKVFTTDRRFTLINDLEAEG